MSTATRGRTHRPVAAPSQCEYSVVPSTVRPQSCADGWARECGVGPASHGRRANGGSAGGWSPQRSVVVVSGISRSALHGYPARHYRDIPLGITGISRSALQGYPARHSTPSPDDALPRTVNPAPPHWVGADAQHGRGHGEVRRKAVAVLGVDDREALLHVLDAADLHRTTRQQTLAPGRRSPVCSALAACDATRRDAASPASQSARDAGACARALRARTRRTQGRATVRVRTPGWRRTARGGGERALDRSHSLVGP